MRDLLLSNPSAQSPAKETAAMRQDDQPAHWTDYLPFPPDGSATAHAADASGSHSLTTSVG